MILWSKNINFVGIRSHIRNYQYQKSIDPNRVKPFLAALLDYDLDAATLFRYLRSHYTGEYRDTKRMIKILEESKCGPKIICDLVF